MNKLKRSILIFAVLYINTAISQTIEQGKQLIGYEKFKSARKLFENLVATNPNNDEAVYWLGQSIILPDDISAIDLEEAKKIYQKTLDATNSQLLMAGVGHIELLQGKMQEARSHFEAAANLSQNKSIAVLNAIGFANSNPDTKNGDAIYAIDKLKMATLIKKFNDPDVLVNLGDAYRKNNDGGNALLSYQAALAINPKYARANYRIGKLYQSQGRGQESIFMEHYENAINNDPAFAPVYSTLFNYYYETNVTKAAEYFEKWQSNSDVDYKSCYYRAALKYAQGFFIESVNMADQCIAETSENPYANLFGLKANAYNRLKDSIKAIENYAEYFKRQSIDKITSGDFVEYAKNLLKIPGNEAQAGVFIDKAVMLDSIEANKIQYLKSIALVYESRKNFSNAAEWYSKILKVKKNPGKVDLYNAGYSYYRAALLDSALTYFNIYAQKYPDDIFGYFMTGKASWAIDSTMSLGLANPALEKAIQIGLTDTLKFKSQLIYSYKYFVAYYATIKKDKNLAIAYNEKILSLDPADAEANANRTILTGGKQPAGAKATETKPPTSGSKSAEGIKKPLPVNNSNEAIKKN